MIELPDPLRAFEHENAFYLTCDPSRIAKLLAHCELYRMVLDVPGALVECGVFKGASLLRFAMFRELFQTAAARQIIAFDVFDRFPDTAYAPDQPHRDRFVAAAGDQSITRRQLEDVLARRHLLRNVELVEGDITRTVPEYAAARPELRIALLHLDTDIYEPAVTVLEHLYPRLQPGGVLVLDDFGTFPGETRAALEYFAGRDVPLRRFPFAATPCYLVKH